ncbi:hypothetical protein V5799_000720 [Amblyomma americanum]|uniref:Uncharacterized protein n=1 Tax=Amblyomma americanum TaxID=6943 RepID=A0AAQ4D288_AMBAM
MEKRLCASSLSQLMLTEGGNGRKPFHVLISNPESAQWSASGTLKNQTFGLLLSMWTQKRAKSSRQN